MLRTALVLTVAIAAAVYAVDSSMESSEEVGYEIPKIPCGGLIGDRYFPSDIRSEHCSADICQISRQEPIEFEIDAVAPYDTSYMFVLGYMYYKLPDNLETVIPIPFPAEVMDGCQSLVNATCPLYSGQEFTTGVNWDWTELAEEIDEGTTFEMEFRIYDETETIATCFRVPVEIVA